MLQNHDYNLLETITIIARSVYRYDTYMKDLDKVKCESCRKMWQEFHEQRQKELATSSCRTRTSPCPGPSCRCRTGRRCGR